MRKQVNLIVITITLTILALTISQTVNAQQSPIIGTTSDNQVQIQMYSFNTNTTIPYYPYTPSHSGYIWAWVDISFKNIGSTGSTVDTNALFASIKDNQNYAYTGEPVANDPQDIKLQYLTSGNTQ